MNLLFAATVPAGSMQSAASKLLVAGAILMPAVCFLSGWRSFFRHLFFLPVLCLVAAVVLVLCGGLP
jgi:hypothetical protein